MKVVFLGASRFGLRCLDALLDLPGVTVAGAVTAPAEFRISYRPQGVRNVLHADVAARCAAAGVPALTLRDGMGDAGLLEQVAAWSPDLFLVAGWYHMVPKAWRALAPAYGLHASLLPDYAGGAPLVWAMIEGESRTGITLFELGDGVDDGPIVGQRETPILAQDTIATLYTRIEALGIELVRTCLPALARGEIAPRAQRGPRRIVPQRGPEDGRIDWTWSAGRVHDFVRAQTRPYPGAFTWLGGRKLTLWATAVHPDGIDGRPGTLRVGSGVLAACGDGAVRILEAELDGAPVPDGQWRELAARHPVCGGPEPAIGGAP